MKRKMPKAIEVVSEPVAARMRAMTIAQRVKMASDSHRFARSMIASMLRHEHPDWTDEQIRAGMVRRLHGGTR